jgi:hemolysin activation/secretion protein
MLMTALVKISDSQAAETDSPAVIEDLFAAPLSTNVPVKLLPTLDVRAYRIESDAALPSQELGVLSNYTGKVDSTRVREGLEKLQDYYGTLGLSNLNVTLPDQKITNGLVRIRVTERTADANTESTLAAAITNLFIAPEKKPTLEVRGYRIEGNSVLPPEKFGVLTNYTGVVDFARVRDGLGALQLLYRDLGFATISVTLPRQKVTNGTVRVKVIEGKLANINVTGNLHFSYHNVLRALPGLETNILLNTKWLQPELDLANQNQDRQIYPVISPGLDPGTSDLTLQVKDRLPLHGHIEINDKSTPGTPLLRIDTAIQYNNLWQLNHQIGFDYNFSPQQMKPDNTMQFYDQPAVASYSGFYRLPLGVGGGLREKYDGEPVDFGYNEVTHQFNLPPLTGQPELIVYASRSTTDTGSTLGPVIPVTQSATLNIFSQDAQRVPSTTENVGSRFILPLPQLAGVQSSVSAGFDLKSYQSSTFYTNYFVVQSINTNDSPPTVRTLTETNVNNSGNSVVYLPLSFGWSGSRPDAHGSFAFNYSQSVFLTPLASARKNFQTIAGSRHAGGNYTTINAGLIRSQNLAGQWSAVLNANGQWASSPLISNEQFGLGGTSGVRGYQNGENYGDTGWRTQFDLRAPPLNVGYFPTQSGDVPADLRCSIFMDYGEVYHLDSTLSAIQQWGTGAGFYLTAGSHFDARLTLAYALLATPTTPVGDVQAYFSVGYQF